VVVNTVINFGTNIPAAEEIAYGKAVINNVFPVFFIASSTEPPEAIVVNELTKALEIEVVNNPVNADCISPPVPAKMLRN
jgi:hypothetical protein